jgi:hypothetical protein
VPPRLAIYLKLLEQIHPDLTRKSRNPRPGLDAIVTLKVRVSTSQATLTKLE